jgi:oligoendopeptidase F
MGATVYLFLHYTSDEVTTYFDKRDIDANTELSSASGCTFSVAMGTDNNKYYVYYVWVENLKDLPVLVHETLHLVKNILVQREIPFNETNHELIAYHLEYWFETLSKLANKKKK